MMDKANNPIVQLLNIAMQISDEDLRKLDRDFRLATDDINKKHEQEFEKWVKFHKENNSIAKDNMIHDVNAMRHVSSMMASRYRFLSKMFDHLAKHAEGYVVAGNIAQRKMQE